VIYRRLDDRRGIARSLWALGNAYRFQERPDLPMARSKLEEALQEFRAGDDRFGLGWALHTLGLCVLRMGELDRARTLFTEALAIFNGVGDLSGVVLVLDDFARLEEAMGHGERAIRLTGAAANLRSSTGTDLANVVEQQEGPVLGKGLTPENVKAAWARGQSMSREEAVSYALEGEEAMRR
jgi:non-specific serine/threonine protein kinase